MGGYQSADGSITFDTDYIGVWYEEQNADVLLDLRIRLNNGRPVLIDFQPGDGTRYEFTILPYADMVTVSNDGREPLERCSDPDALMAVIGNGLGDGVGRFNRRDSDGDQEYIMRSIRDRINAKMDVMNPCTVEALAATIFVLWYMDH